MKGKQSLTQKYVFFSQEIIFLELFFLIDNQGKTR